MVRLQVVKGKYAYVTVRVPGKGPRRLYLGKVDPFRLELLKGFLAPSKPGPERDKEVEYYFRTQCGGDSYTLPELAVFDALERGLYLDELRRKAWATWSGEGGSGKR